MSLPRKIQLTDLFHYNVRSSDGVEYGSGVMVWMHPPVHRVLGWITKPSNLNLQRNVWRLNQLISFNNDFALVNGQPAISDQSTLDRFPSLIETDLLNSNGEKLGVIADLVFDSKTGKILYYLVSRSNPKLPGTSRWLLNINSIEDQKPGVVSTYINTLYDLSLVKSSIREEFLQKSRQLTSQIQEIRYKASDKLEGWLDENENFQNDNNYSFDDDIKSSDFDDWVDNESRYEEDVETLEQFNVKRRNVSRIKGQDDPWI